MPTPRLAIPEPPTLPPVSGVRGAVLYVGGLVALGTAYVGVLLPGLPTVPWLLLASFCFARTSPRLQRWLWYSPLFGPLLRDFYLHRGMRPRSKWVAVPMVVAACTASITLFGLPDEVRLAIGACGAVGVAVILFAVPTVRE